MKIMYNGSINYYFYAFYSSVCLHNYGHQGKIRSTDDTIEKK